MADFADLKPIITNNKRGRYSSNRPRVLYEEIIETPDELIIAGKSKGPEPKSDEQRKSSSKYFGMEDLYYENEVFDESHWEAMIGFTLVRIASPLFFIIHCAFILGVLYYKYGFSIDDQTAKIMPHIMFPLVLNLAVVHVFNKWYFSGSYYKLRTP
ncbi:hypothetical protein OGAPHI_007028 [Ogataea philodendri]|uniref:Uncharacterized protein n=1 Tax=Ogataea philodendri TaxID=1378263 RepID=A0A9P8NVY1_9ASCO|nr:uncharacterized protein OGAPHI_007028 [Ogataea philodendri]KAH3660442.1 hypothetical protein OGAPHI_007028 [Ogataea philodendri]